MRIQEFKDVHTPETPSQPWIKQNDIFVGNLSKMTNEGTLRTYFADFGEIIDVRLMMDKRTGQSRRFAFISFEKKESVTNVLRLKNQILDGKTIDVKKCFKTSRLPLKTLDLGPIFNVPPPTPVETKFALVPQHPPPSFRLPKNDNNFEFEGGIVDNTGSVPVYQTIPMPPMPPSNRFAPYNFRGTTIQPTHSFGYYYYSNLSQDQNHNQEPVVSLPALLHAAQQMKNQAFSQMVVQKIRESVGLPLPPPY